MLRKRHFYRLLLVVLCTALLAAGTLAQAAEPVPSITYNKITQNGQAVDSLNGVDALYNLPGYSTLYCTEYVIRYYEEVYGLDVFLSGNGPVVRNSDEYWFEKVEADDIPQTGDILYGASWLRGKSYNHWAIVKAYDQYSSMITVIEQNWTYNGSAGVDRLLEYPTSYYYIYRLVSASGAVTPQVSAEHQLTSTAAKAAVNTASALGIATVADGFQNAVTISDFLGMCCNTIRAVTGEETWADADDPLAAAYDCGLITDPQRDPDEAVTREQAAVILTRLAERIGSLPETDESVLTLYTDADAIGETYRPFVAAVTSTGLLGGGESFLPQQALTVEEALVCLTGLAQTPERELLLVYEDPEDPALARMAQPAPAEAEPAQAGVLAADAASAVVSDLIRKG